ncbi:hypothetical protein FRC17_006254 [Serendipita sp. 399]|nr:hypothetical protein FRC17_006254 [Serendipita sp. 399]
MGMPLFSTHSTPYASTARALMELSMEEGELRRWQETDGDPEEESWWTGKHVFAELFIDPSARIAAGSSLPDATTTSEAPGARSAMEAHNPSEASGAREDQPLQRHPLLVGVPPSTWTASGFPGRYTISEQELAQVSLDTIVKDDDEDDFELAWDESSEYGAEEDSTSEASSTISTPTPSTPVATHTFSLPITVPITPGPVRRRTVPVPTTPTPAASPMRTGSFQMSTSARTPPPSKSPIATRSVNRVRGFALASPRTELVL